MVSGLDGPVHLQGELAISLIYIYIYMYLHEVGVTNILQEYIGFFLYEEYNTFLFSKCITCISWMESWYK